MATYRVRPGKELAHGGEILAEGKTVELPRHVGTDQSVNGLVDEVDELGRVVQPALMPAVEAELATAMPHERVTILEVALAKNTADGDLLRAAIADEVKTKTSVQEVEPARAAKYNPTPVVPKAAKPDADIA